MKALSVEQPWAWAIMRASVALTAFVVSRSATIRAEDDPQVPSKVAWKESEVINPKLPPYIFSIEATGEGEVTIKIRGGPKSYKGQTIYASVEDEKRPDFQICDINLDGYKDFCLVENRGATGNINFEYWVFNPKRGVFREASEFDAITYVDEKKGLLVSHSKGGNIETITEYFGLTNGEPMILKSVRTTWAREVRDIVPSKYSDETPITITRIYRYGRLVRTFFTEHFVY